MVHVQLLGAPQLHAADGSMRALERREAALLALLAIEGPMPRSRAAALLWSDADSEHARSSLRQRLFKLRRSAGIDVVVPDDMLRLAEGVAHDLVPISPRLAEDPTAGAAELLGDLDYSDCPGLDDWVTVAREQWRSRRIHALAEIAARLEAEQKIAAALPYAERLVADDPTLEHGHRRLMRLHYLRGDRAAALAVYARCRELLRLHAGATPGKETVELVRLIEGSGALPVTAAAPMPLSVLRPPRLVGRDREWQQLERAFETSRSAVLLGEPGVGKSRLMSDWSVRDNAVQVSARPGDESFPYAFTARWLRVLNDRWTPGNSLPREVRAEAARLLPEWGAVPKEDWHDARFQQAIGAMVAAAFNAGCRLIALDDLHFADDASLRLLPLLAGASERSMRWLLAARRHELPTRLAEWARAEGVGSLVEIEVQPLDPATVRTLLESLNIAAIDAGALAAPMTRHTGGNPLFILETLRAMLSRTDRDRAEGLALPAPAPVAYMIELRLARLPALALDLARVAAIAGQDFSAELASRVLAKPPLALVDAWNQLESAQVLRDSAFAHDLVYEAALRSVPHGLARLLHAQVARCLEAQAATPSRVARHWQDAGEMERAGQAFVEAARGAEALNALGEAADFYCSAAQAFAQAGQQAASFEAGVERSRLLDSLKRFAEQDVLVHQLLASASSERQRMLAAMRRGIHRLCERPNELALADLCEAHALALGLGAEGRDVVTELSWRVAFCLCFLGRVDEALGFARDAMRDIDGHPEEAKWRREYANLLEFGARYPQALEQAERAVALARLAGNRRLLSECLITRSTVLGNLGRQADNERDCTQARALLQAVEGTDRPTVYDRQLAALHRDTGRFDSALALIVPALEWFRANDNPWWVQYCTLELARLYLTLGQAARTQQLLDTIDVASASMRFSLLCTRARLAKALGQPALPLLEQAIPLVEQTERPRAHRWILAIELPPHLEAQAALERAQPAAEETLSHGARAWYRPLRLRWIDALSRAGRHDEAAPAARELASELRAQRPFWIYGPETWWNLFQVFDAVGDRAAAREALAQGRDWILQTALPHVPDEFRDSFLNRNTVNRDLLAAAHRLLA